MTLPVLICCPHFQHRDVKLTHWLLKPPEMADTLQCEYDGAFLLTVNYIFELFKLLHQQQTGCRRNTPRSLSSTTRKDNNSSPKSSKLLQTRCSAKAPISRKRSWFTVSHLCQTCGILTTAVSLLLQVCEWKEPEELAQLLDLELRAAGEPHPRLLERVRDVAKYSVKTSEDAGSHT